MALRMCPQCKQNVSDITGNCPVCDYSFAVTQLDFSKKAPTPVKQSKPEKQKIDLSGVDWSKAFKHPILMIFAFVVFIVSLVYLFKGKILLGLVIMFVAWFLWMYGIYGAQTAPTTRKKCCARCGSDNLAFSVQYGQQIIGATSEVRKKSIISRAGNDIGRAGMILATGGLWALTPKRSKYKETITINTRETKHKIAVCQDCGYSWEMFW